MPRRGGLSYRELIDKPRVWMFPFVPYITGRYIGSHAFAEVAFIGATANRIYYSYMYIHDVVTIDQMAVDVSASAAGNARLGIYLPGDDGKPDALVVDSGVVDVSTTGTKTATVSVTLAPGPYYVALHTSDTPQFRCTGTSVSSSAGGFSAGTPYGGFEEDQTFAALPDPATPNIHNGNTYRVASAVQLRVG